MLFLKPIIHSQIMKFLFIVVLQRSRYHRSHSLNYKNGYALPSHPEVGIGGDPIVHNQLSEQELDELANFNPTLTYGQAREAPPEDFVPGHVAWDKKVCILSKNFCWFVKVHVFPCNVKLV